MFTITIESDVMPPVCLYVNPWENPIIRCDDCSCNNVEDALRSLVLDIMKVNSFAALGHHVYGDIGKNLKLLSCWLQSGETQFAFRDVSGGGWEVFIRLVPDEESKAHILADTCALDSPSEIFNRIAFSCASQLENCDYLAVVLQQLRQSLLDAVNCFANPELVAAVNNLTVANSPCFTEGDAVEEVEKILSSIDCTFTVSARQCLDGVALFYDEVALIYSLLKMQKILVAQYRMSNVRKIELGEGNLLQVKVAAFNGILGITPLSGRVLEMVQDYGEDEKNSPACSSAYGV